MPISVHNPDQYMSSLRQIIAQGRKRIGLLIGAGAPASITAPGSSDPLIPVVAGLSQIVFDALAPTYGATLDAIRADIPNANIEDVLSRVRSLGAVIGTTAVYGIDGAAHKQLSEKICDEIGKVVNKKLPSGSTPYSELVTWISGTSRQHPVEIFTTNYDLLFEQALELAHVPYFDGFAGAAEPFFDPSTVANNDLPSRWTRIWKLHGSLGWSTNSLKEIVRIGGPHATHLVFPEHLKYEQTKKAPYSALFDRLAAFLLTPDTLLVATGFSFADSHISARIDECLTANASASLFAFQHGKLEKETYASAMAYRRANISLYSPNGAIINGVAADWLPGDPPTRDWAPIRASYWGPRTPGGSDEFLLGDYVQLARFFASSHSGQTLPVAGPSSTGP